MTNKITSIAVALAATLAVTSGAMAASKGHAHVRAQGAGYAASEDARAQAPDVRVSGFVQGYQSADDSLFARAKGDIY